MVVLLLVRRLLVLDGHVADRFVRRGLDVRAGNLRLLTGRPYLQIPVRTPFPIGQCHVVRTPARASAAQVAIVVDRAATTVEAAATLVMTATGGLEVAVA